MPKYINKDVEMSSDESNEEDSDEENPDDENSSKNFDEENKNLLRVSCLKHSPFLGTILT